MCHRTGVVSILSTDIKVPTRLVVGEPILISLHDPYIVDTAEPSIRLLSRRTEYADEEIITLTSSKPDALVLETQEVSVSASALVAHLHRLRLSGRLAVCVCVLAARLLAQTER